MSRQWTCECGIKFDRFRDYFQHYFLPPIVAGLAVFVLYGFISFLVSLATGGCQ